jgi:hypothetical protein
MRRSGEVSGVPVVCFDMGFVCSALCKNLGAKVFMDAHEPVTLEEGDRYPLAPPSFESVSKYGHAIKVSSKD